MAQEIKVDPIVAPIIEAHVQAAIVTELGRNPGALIDALVKQALMAPADNYSRKTKFGAAVEAMIQQAAQDSFKRWLEEQRPLIEKAILTRMNREKTGFVAKVADKLVDALASKFTVYINLKVDGE